jgi:iron complex transport system substrate-binding protein
MNERRILLLALAALATASCARHVAPGALNGLARRVISLAPATTEALFAIGAGARVVGRSRFCDWPPSVLALPAVGGFVDADMEAILGLAPDLVVGTASPNAQRVTDALSPRGIATWFPEVDSVIAIERMLVGLGERTGMAGDSRRAADDVARRTLAVARSVRDEPSPRVLTIVGAAPVVGAGPNSFLDELLRMAGAINVLRAGPPWQTLDAEQMIELDPDVIVDGSNQDAAASAANERAPGWREVRAVKIGRVLALNDPRLLRPGPRVPEGLALLAHALHPKVAPPVW